MTTEIEKKADFAILRYAQVWEDTDILLKGLDIQKEDTCVSIASAGDNALAMITQEPKKVIALDINPIQIATLELKIAAFRQLNHQELLEFLGAIPSQQRKIFYERCRKLLAPQSKTYWDDKPEAIEQGFINSGKFETYLSDFRKRILPLMHKSKTIQNLLTPNKNLEERIKFYRKKWCNWRWEILFHFFFSRWLMGKLGRHPDFFKYVKVNVSKNLMERVKYALTQLDPAENPYLQWILTGQYHPPILPFILRPENFDLIRDNIPRLKWRQQSLEELLEELGENSVDRFNLSDIFEYMSEENYNQLITTITKAGKTGGRIMYWNMLVPRSRPENLQIQLKPVTELAQNLHQEDKTFFYSKIIIEEFIK